jgi:hypothetical protein
MFIKYRHSRYGTYGHISREVFVRETDDYYITDGGRRWAKEAQEYAYANTWEEARSNLLRRARHLAKCAEREVRDLEAMTEPPWRKDQ